jgi:hypothetical protein
VASINFDIDDIEQAEEVERLIRISLLFDGAAIIKDGNI